MASVFAEESGRNQPHAGQEVDQQRQFEHEGAGYRDDDDGGQVVADVEHVGDELAGLVVGEEVDRQRRHDEITEQQPSEETERHPEYEQVGSLNLLRRERRAYEAPELPQRVGHGHCQSRQERDLHVEVELPGQRSVDDRETVVGDAEGLRIGVERRAEHAVEPFGHMRPLGAHPCQHAVGGEVRALWPEQHRVDNETLAEEGHQSDDSDCHHPSHQMRAQGVDVLEKSHLRRLRILFFHVHLFAAAEQV